MDISRQIVCVMQLTNIFCYALLYCFVLATLNTHCTLCTLAVSLTVLKRSTMYSIKALSGLKAQHYCEVFSDNVDKSIVVSSPRKKAKKRFLSMLRASQTYLALCRVTNVLHNIVF